MTGLADRRENAGPTVGARGCIEQRVKKTLRPLSVPRQFPEMFLFSYTREDEGSMSRPDRSFILSRFVDGPRALEAKIGEKMAVAIFDW